ncbi:MAG: hypothetical protein IJA35_01865 [Clostridia bacterium]|nr:hypothetical protein [Clostridia bacterium]
MKKNMYYIMPFVILPCLMLLLQLLNNMEMLKMSPYIMVGVLLFISAIVGFFSSTHMTFDYLMTAIMPLSFFCTMFIAGFLDKSDMETRFHIYKAVNASFQPICLLLYFLMALITFLASFKKIRNVKSK